jgi:CheY-like chemotaxis protein
VERWRAGGHDAILMDCQMPEMSGFEATLEIRRLEGERHIPIIAMTAQAYPEDRERCLLSGMDDYVAKPVTRKTLHATLSRWIDLESMVPESSVDPPLRAPAIDVTALRQLEEQLGESGRELLAQLVRRFSADVPVACTRMTELLSRGDGDAVAFEAHRLHSAAAYLSAAELARDCRALERAARAGELNSARELLAGLAGECEGARLALEAYVRNPRPQLGEVN